MKISEIITDKYKLRMPPTVYYELLADVVEAEDEQEPCEDAISRKELLSAFPVDDEPYITKHSLRMTINHMPSVHPKVKTGHWYDKCGKDGCSVCNEGIDDAQTFDGRPFKYCPMCGARMIEPQESEDKE